MSFHFNSAIRNIITLTARWSTLESDVHRRQILTTKGYPSTVRVNYNHVCLNINIWKYLVSNENNYDNLLIT